MKRIAVLGGGGTGCTLAADLTHKGFSVTLFEFPEYYAENLADVERIGEITMEGMAGSGTYRPALVTRELAAAVEGAELIFIAMLSSRHGRIVEELAPLLKDGQSVCFSAGNCASVMLRRALGPGHPAVVGEMGGNIYPCRMAGPGRVSCAMPYKPKRVAACPGRDTGRLLEALEGVYECLPAKSPIQTTLNSPNLNNHLAASILNVGGIEKNPGFRLYRDGFTPRVVELIDTLELEKKAVMDAMDYPFVSFVQSRRNILAVDSFPELDPFRDIAGPDSLQHRYITEDASTGLCLLESLARLLDIDTPVLSALLTLASTLNHTDYRQGRNLEALGLGGMSPEEIVRWLSAGEEENKEETA